MNKKSIKDVQVKGKKCLVRVDFNVPMKDGKITERGSFDELMELNGDFAEVYNTQQAQRKSMVDFDALATESGVM